MTTTRRSRVRKLVAATAIAAGAIGLTAPIAGAMTRQDVYDECQSMGGTFRFSASQGNNYVTCTYGNYTDFYQTGFTRYSEDRSYWYTDRSDFVYMGTYDRNGNPPRSRPTCRRCD